MAAPKQTIGLTNFAFSISKCPPNPDAIRSIVFTKCDNLAVVNGANTEILIPLTNFYVPVDNAARLSFSITGSTSSAPILLQKMDLGGVDTDGQVKFLSILPQYGTGTTQSASQYLEWTSISSIENEDLYDAPADGPSSITGLDTTEVNKLEFSWGGYISFTGGTGSLWAATNGGLLKWDGTNMKLWNTLNSNSPSDFMSSIAISSYGMWIGTNLGIVEFDETEGFTNSFNTSNSGIPSDNVNDIKYLSDGRLAIATDNGLSIYDGNTSSATTWTNANVYNSTSLLNNKILNLQVTSDPYVFAGTTGGVYKYDVGASAWGTSYNSSDTPGWSAGNNVQCIDIFDGNLYVGTSNGMVVVPYAGGTATTYTTAGGATGGPISNDIRCIRYVSYQGDKIYMGHNDGFSIFDIESDTWSSADSTTYTWMSGGVSDILPNYLDPTLLNETILFSSSTSGSGLSKLLVDSSTFSVLPGDTDVANLLLTYPTSKTYSYTPTKLYANNQPLYFMFSKSMNAGSFQNSFFLGTGLTGAGGTVSGTWVWDSPSRQATFYPGGLTASYLDAAVSYADASEVTVSPTALKNVFPGQQAEGSSGLFQANTIVESISVSGSNATVQFNKPTDFITVGDTITFRRSSSPLEKSQLYNMRIAYGATAQDATYLVNTLNTTFYTENIVPLSGWKPVGKMLTLSGTEGNYTEGIYLRNPQSASINVTALVGR